MSNPCSPPPVSMRHTYGSQRRRTRVLCQAGLANSRRCPRRGRGVPRLLCMHGPDHLQTVGCADQGWCRPLGQRPLSRLRRLSRRRPAGDRRDPCPAQPHHPVWRARYGNCIIVLDPSSRPSDPGSIAPHGAACDAVASAPCFDVPYAAPLLVGC